jgi:hypothetical protein
LRAGISSFSERHLSLHPLVLAQLGSLCNSKTILAIEKGHEPVVFVDDISIDPARRDPAKYTFAAHVASPRPRVVPMLCEHKAFPVVPSTAAT